MALKIPERIKKYAVGSSKSTLSYYDNLSRLFEKAAWATIVWAFVLNIISPVELSTKNYTFLLIFCASCFNIFYFRYLYWRLRKQKYRYYLSEATFPVFIWVFIHLHQEFIPYLLLPYYILLLSTSLTLKRFDTLLALIVSTFFIFLETIGLKRPIVTQTVEIGLAQIGSLVVFSWIALSLADFIRAGDDQVKELIEDVGKETDKAATLRRFAADLVLDKEKAQILIAEAEGAVVLIDNQKKIIDLSPKFKEMTDFKSDALVGKELDYVLKTETTFNLNKETYLPEEFVGTITTRRNKSKVAEGVAHFLVGQDTKVKQILIFFK